MGLNLLFLVDEMLYLDICKSSNRFVESCFRKMSKYASMESFDYPLLQKQTSGNSPKAKGAGTSGLESANISGFARNSCTLIIKFMNHFLGLLNIQVRKNHYK